MRLVRGFKRFARPKPKKSEEDRWIGSHETAWHALAMYTKTHVVDIFLDGGTSIGDTFSR